MLIRMKFVSILLFLFFNITTSYAIASSSQSQSHLTNSKSHSLFPVVTTNVQASHISGEHSSSGAEQLIIIATHKTDIKSPKSQQTISQAATSFIFTFDLDRSIDLVTLPGLPLKLYPSKESKMSTFATFLPEESDGYFNLVRDQEEDDDEQHKEPLLWDGYEEALCGSSIAVIETHPDTHVRTVVIQTWINLQKLPEIRLELPGKPSFSNPTKSVYAKILGKFHDLSVRPSMPTIPHPSSSSTDSSIKNAVLHYYRGHKIDCSGYSTFEEISDYFRTMFVSVLSPFVLLGILLICTAIGVFVWLHVLYESDPEDEVEDPDPIVDEKRRIFLV